MANAAGRAAWIAALAAYSALAVVWMRPMSLSPANVLPDVGDAAHLAYVMAWDAHQLVRRPWALFESNSFHPWPHSLAFGDHLVPEALVVAPIFWATGNAVLAYNVSVFLALVLSALCMLVLVRELTGSAAAAFVAGLAYAFNGFTFIEVARVQVVHFQWWPLALLFLLRFLRTGRRRHALWFALLVAVQGLAGTYYLVYSVLIAPIWFVLVYAAWRRPTPAELRSLALGLVLAMLVVAPFIIPYLGRLAEAEGTVSTGVDLLAFVTAGAANPLFGTGARDPSYAREYLGHVGLALMAAGLCLGVRRRREGDPALFAFTLLGAATLLFGLAMALGPVIRAWGVERMPGPLALVLEVLPLTSLRHTPRFAALTKLGGAILVGIAVDRLTRPLPASARTAAVAVLAVLLPLEHWQPPLYGSRLPAGGEVPAVYRWLSEEGRGPLVELPLYAKKRFWALYLYFSTYHWRPVPIGRTSFYPPSHELLATTLSRFPEEASLEVLHRLGVRTVVVHPEVWEERERAPRLAQLAAAPGLVPVRTFAGPSVLPWLSESRVYRLARDDRPPPCRLEVELSREGWRVVARTGGVGALLDGRLDTAWTTGRPQRTGDRLRVVFGAPAELSAVVLQSGAAFGEFPRNPVVELQDDSGAWSEPPLVDAPLERWRTVEALMKDPVSAPWVMRFEPRRAVALRVTLASEGMFTAPWTVAELKAFARCRPADLPASREEPQRPPVSDDGPGRGGARAARKTLAQVGG